MIFENNYFITQKRNLIKLAPKQTHADWIRSNRPHESRESLCDCDWVILATFVDRHVIQISDANFGKLRTINENLLLLPRKDTVVMQTSSASYELPYDRFVDIDDPGQLWAYKL
jgi:hypothetical protein